MSDDIMTRERYGNILRKNRRSKEKIIAYWECADDVFACLKNNPRIVSLLIHRCGNITDDSLRYISELKNLKRLYFCHADITGRGLKYLVDRGTRLEHLEMIYMDALDPKYYEYFSSFKDLKWLGLYHSRLDETFLPFIEGCTKLVDLDLSFSNAGAMHGEVLENLRNVDNLVIETAGMTDDFLRHVARLDRLRRLMIRNNPITAKGIAQLPPFENLTEFSVEMNPVGDESMKVVARFPKLLRLEIGDTGMTDKGIEYLSQGPAAQTLERICMENNPGLTGKSISLLHDRFPKVERVSLSYYDESLGERFELDRKNGVTLDVEQTDENIPESYIQHHITERELPEDYSPTLYRRGEKIE